MDCGWVARPGTGLMEVLLTLSPSRRTPVAALQRPSHVLQLKWPSYSGASCWGSRGLSSPPDPRPGGPRATIRSSVTIFGTRPQRPQQGTETLQGDHFKTRDTPKAKAVAARPPPALLLRSAWPGHRLIGRESWWGLWPPHPTISYHCESAGPVGPGDLCPPWHLPLWGYNSK